MMLTRYLCLNVGGFFYGPNMIENTYLQSSTLIIETFKKYMEKGVYNA